MKVHEWGGGGEETGKDKQFVNQKQRASKDTGL